MAEDYYALLGLEKGATKEQIKKAYKKLAMKFHPDRAPEDKKKEYEEKFKEISQAAAVLSDDKKKQQYDQFGTTDGNAFEGFDFSDIFSQFRGGGFDDIFDNLFSRGRRRVRRGSDLVYDLEISLEEAAFGVEKEITVNKLARCDTCEGIGGTDLTTCDTCRGSGQVRRTQRTPFGLFQQTVPCERCSGRGEKVTETCKTCDGEALVRKKKKLEVNIPAGVDTGNRLRIAGEGEPGQFADLDGDLYIRVHVTAHKFFKRQHEDIYVDVPISFSQAALGDSIDVPTLTREATLKIPAGTQSGTLLRMKNKGIASLNNHYTGDQYVKVEVQIPKKLSKKQVELIKKLGEEKPAKGFFESVFGLIH